MEYKVIDRVPEIEAKHKGRPRKWKSLFLELPINKAIRFTLDTQKEAVYTGVCICGSLRKMRIYQDNFRIRYRTLPDGDKFILYVWKEAR